MPDIYMDVDSALAEVPTNILPLVDDTDFKAIKDAVAYNASGMALRWHFSTTAGAYTVTSVTPTSSGVHDWTDQGDSGIYTLEIPASGGTINNDTEGFGWFTGVATGILPWRGPVIAFRAAEINNVLIDSAWDANRGLAGTALPAAAADAAGGLAISIAGGLDLDAILADTNELQADDIPGSLSTISGKIDDVDNYVDTEVAAIKSVVDDILVDTAALQTDWANDGRLDAILDTAAAGLDAADVNAQVDIALSDLRLDELFTAPLASQPTAGSLLADLTEDNGGTQRFTADSLENAPSGSGASASAIAAAVWNEPTSGHTTEDTFGEQVATDIDTILVDTDSLNGTKIPDTLSLSAINAEVDGCLELYDAPKHSELTTAIATLATPAQVLTQATLALTDLHLDHLLAANYDPAAPPGDSNALLNELIQDGGGTGVSQFTANALERGPSGAGILAPLVLVDTTVVSIDGGQTSVVLTAGSGDDDAYNGRTIVFTDQSTATQKSVRRITDYVGSSKTITLDSAPDFTVAASDACVVLSLPGIGGSDVAAELTTYDPPTKAEMDTAIAAVGAGPLILADTVITGLVSQTVFRLTAGSADDDAYVGMLVIVTDASTAAQKAVGIVSDYTGSTKEITLRSDPGVFAMANLDLIQVVAVSTPEAGSGALTPAELNQLRYWVGIDGTQTAPSSNTPSLASLANQTTTHNRLGAWTGTGVNTLLGALKAMLSKSASLPSDIGGSMDPASDSVEALRERGDISWITGPAAASPFSEDDAKGVRYILNLDGTQVAPAVAASPRLVVNATQIEGADPSDTINSACDVALIDYAGSKPSDITAAQTSIEADIAALTATIPSAAAVSTAVWGESTRALTDKVGFALTSGERAAISTLLQADLEDLSAAEVLTQASSALATYDGPKHSELTSDTASIIAAISGLDTASSSDVLTQTTAALATYNGPKHSELLSDTASIVAAISGLEDLDAAAIAAQVVSGLTTYDAVNQTDLNTSQAAIIAALPASGGTVSLSVTSPPQDGDTVVLKRGNPATLVFTVVDVITMSDVLLGISDEAGRSLLKLSGVIDTTTQCTFSISISDALILREGSFNLDVFEVAGYDATTGAYTDAKSIVTGPVTIEPLYLRLEND